MIDSHQAQTIPVLGLSKVAEFSSTLQALEIDIVLRDSNNAIRELIIELNKALFPNFLFESLFRIDNLKGFQIDWKDKPRHVFVSKFL